MAEQLDTMPLWTRKFTNWKMMQTTCPAAFGPVGVYCLWAGHNCGYETCPRRIFEEVTVDVNAIPITVPEKLRDRINQQDVQLAKQEAKIAELQQQFNTLMDELKKPPWEVRLPS
jgi:hypothetical protein